MADQSRVSQLDRTSGCDIQSTELRVRSSPKLSTAKANFCVGARCSAKQLVEQIADELRGRSLTRTTRRIRVFDSRVANRNQGHCFRIYVEGIPTLVADTEQIQGILGMRVRNSTGEDMGRIVDVIVDRSARVIDFGGFLGVGSRLIVVACTPRA